MDAKRVNIFFSTFNAVLAIAGYQLVAVVFGLLFGSTDSRIITIFYRLFAFAICLIVIVLNLKDKMVINRPSRILVLFWLLVLFRFVYDMFFRTDIVVPYDYKLRTGLFIFIINIVPIISLVLSYKNIQLEKALRMVLLFLSIAVVLSFLSNESMQQVADDYVRNDTAGLGPIGTGHLGLTTLFLSVFMIKQKNPIWKSFMYVVLALLSLLIMLRSGSRSPVLSFIIVIGFVIAGKSKSPIPIIILFSVFFLFSDYIITGVMDAFDSIAPNLTRRFTHHSDEGQFDTRISFFTYAWTAFKESPIWGRYFAIYEFDEIIYPHNLFLDVLMQLGIIGFGLLSYLVIKTCGLILKFIKHNNAIVWIGLIFIQYFSELLVSSAYYLTPIFSISMVLLLLSRNGVDNTDRKKQISASK